MSLYNPIQGENRPKAKRYLVYRYLAFYAHPALLVDYAVQHGLETVYRELASLRRTLGDALPAPLRSLYACAMLEMQGEDLPTMVDQPTYFLQQFCERAHHQGDDLLRGRCAVLLAGKPHFRSLDASRYWSVPHRCTAVRGYSPLIHHQLSDGRLLCLLRSPGSDRRFWVLLHEDGSYDRELYHFGSHTWMPLFTRDGRVLVSRADGKLWLTSIDDETLIPMEGHHYMYRLSSAKELADGRMVTFAYDSFFCVWSSDAELLLKLGDHLAYPSAVQWRDDEKVWTGDEAGTLRLWSPDGSYLKRVEAGDARITRLRALSGNRMVSCDADGRMKLWSQDGALIADCGDGHHPSQEVLEIADGKWISYPTHKPGLALLWGSQGEALGVFGLREGEVLRYSSPDRLPDGRICMMINRNGLRWVKPDGSSDCEVFDDAEIGMTIPLGDKILTVGWGIWDRLWNADGTPAAELRTRGCEQLMLLRDDFVVITDPHFRLWDLELAEYHEWHGHDGRIAFIREDEQCHMRTYGLDGALRIWDADGCLIRVHATGIRGRATPLSHGRFVVHKHGLGDEEDVLLLCSTAAPPRTLALNDPESRLRWRSVVPLSQNGRFLTSCSRNSMIWNADGSLHERSPHTINGSTSLPGNRDLLFGYDCGLVVYSDHIEQVIDDGATYDGGNLLLSGHVLAWSENRLCIWSLDGSMPAEMRGHDRSIDGAVEVSDGRILSWSGATYPLPRWVDEPVYSELRLWSSRGELLNALQSTQIKFVLGALTLPDGGWVTWGHGALCWWSSDGQPQRLGSGNSSCGVFALPDGKLISCGGQSVHLWSAEGEHLAVHRVHDLITSANLHSSGVLVIGDEVGRVQFLQIM